MSLQIVVDSSFSTTLPCLQVNTSCHLYVFLFFSTMICAQAFAPLGTVAQKSSTKNIVITTEIILSEQQKITKPLFVNNILKPGNKLRAEVQQWVDNGNAKLTSKKTSIIAPSVESRSSASQFHLKPMEHDPAESTEKVLIPTFLPPYFQK